MVTLQEIEVREKELQTVKSEAQQVANEPIPERKYGSGVTRQTQQQAIQRRAEAQKVIQQVNTAEQQLQQTRSEVIAYNQAKAQYEAEQKQYNEYLQGQKLAKEGKYAGKLSKSAYEGYKGVLDTKAQQLAQQEKQIPTSLPGVSAQEEESKMSIPKTPTSRPTYSYGYEKTSPIEDYMRKLKTKGGGYAILGGVISAGYSATQAVIHPVQTVKAIPSTAKEVGTRVITGQGFPEVSYSLRTQPYYSTGVIAGNVLIYKAPTLAVKTSDIIRTAGLTELKASTVIAPEYFAGQRYPAIYKGQTAGQLLQEFKAPGLTGFTASPKPLAKQTIALRGTSELPGIYQAPKVSPTFLRVSGERKLFGLNVFETWRPSIIKIKPTAYELTPFVSEKSTGGLTRERLRLTKEFYETKAEKGKSYIPFIKTEKEAVIPFGTELKQVGKRYYTRFEGRRIPIYEFETTSAKVSVGEVTTAGKVLKSYSYTRRSRPVFSSYEILSIASYSKGSLSYSKAISMGSILKKSNKTSMKSSRKGIITSSYTQKPASSRTVYPYISKGYVQGLPKLSYAPGITGKGASSLYMKGKSTQPRKSQGISQAFRAFVIKGGKKKYISGGLTKGQALKFGEEYTLKNLRATFGVEKSRGYVSGSDVTYTPSKKIFRGYKIQKGKKIPLINTFIQRKGGKLEGGPGRLITGGEKKEILKAKKLKGGSVV